MYYRNILVMIIISTRFSLIYSSIFENYKTSSSVPEPPLPDDTTSNFSTKNTEPKIPSIVEISGLTTKSKEQKIPSEVNGLSMKTPEPEPFIPKQQNVLMTTKREPRILNNLRTINSPTTAKPKFPDAIIISKLTTPVAEPKFPKITSYPISTAKSEPIIPDDIQTHAKLLTEHELLTEASTLLSQTTKKEPIVITEANTRKPSLITDSEPVIPTELKTPKITTMPTEPTVPTEQVTRIESRTESTESNVPSNRTINTSINSTKSTSHPTNVQTTTSTENTDIIQEPYYEECLKQGVLCTEGSYCDETTMKCVCNAKIGYKKTVSGGCQRISPCDKSFKRCGTAKCVVLSDDIEAGFKCDCDIGYSLVEEKFCRPVKCQYPSLTKCNQICIDNEEHDKNFNYNPEYFCSCFDGYNLANDKKMCTAERTDCKAKYCGNRGFCVKDKCVCKQRYSLIDGKCEIDQNWCSTNCMEQNGQCIESNGGVVCNCSAPKYRLDTNTGLCNAINFCDKTEVGGKLCNDQRALCVKSISDKGYECQCPKGTQLDGEKCRDSCDITSNKFNCESMNAKCVYNSILGISCNCNPGLYWSSSDQKCLMAQFSTKTKFQLRNPDLIQGSTYYDSSFAADYYDKEGLSDGLNNQNSIIGDILGALTDSLKKNIDVISGVSLINCDRLSDKNTDFNCEISIQMNSTQDLENLKQKLQNCEKIGAEEYCYLPPKTLIARKTEPIFSNLNPCTDISNACSMSLNSKCHSVEGSTKYECLCPENGFHITEARSLGGGLICEYCEDIDECAKGECRANEKTCINTIGSFKCYCNKGYKMNSTQDCVPVCDGVDCGHGVCEETGNNEFWCKCNDGYSGGNCITKASSPSPTAFIISLSVLAFVFLLIAVIAAFCIGKLKGVSKGDYDIQWGEWQTTTNQRTSAKDTRELPRVNSRIRETEQ